MPHRRVLGQDPVRAEQPPRLTRDVLTGEVYGRTDITPFAWWAGRFGLAPLWALAVAIVALALWIGRRRQRP